MSTREYKLTPAGMEDDDDGDYYYDNDTSFLNNNVEKTCKNMKITIVPNITVNAGLNNTSFDATLEPEILKWFQQLKNIWNIYKRGATVTNALHSFYTTSTNPFLYGLKLYANCCEETVKTNSLSYSILEELHNYKRSKNDEIDFSKLIDDNIKMVAFNFVRRQTQQSMYKMVIATFNLRESNGLFRDKLQEMLTEQHLYKEVCQLAFELEMFQEYTIYDFIFPLILQNKISIAEDYLVKAQHLQIELVELLDTLLNTSSSTTNSCYYYISKYKYVDCKIHRFQQKQLTKLIMRLAKKYNVPHKSIPNVYRIKNYGALQFLLHKKFVEKSLNQDSWREMVNETVPESDENLQIELVSGCSFYSDYADAAYWASYYNIKHELLPVLVKDYLRERHGLNEIVNLDSDSDWESEVSGGCGGGSSKNTHQRQKSHSPQLVANQRPSNSSRLQPQLQQQQQEQQHHTTNPKATALTVQVINKQKSEYYYTLSPVMESKICLINTRENFYRMLRYLCGQCIVAFDSEWKPTFKYTNEVAIIQIATKEQIYLIDALTLAAHEDDWYQLGRNIFNNNEILKLAFAPSGDFQMLQKSLPSLGLTALSISSYLDLQELWKKLDSLVGFTFPHSHEVPNATLSSLAKLCFGKELDKSNQFSNWEKRPLRQEQIIYAALDAYCLIEIYEIIAQQFTELDHDFDDYINNFLMEKKSKIPFKKFNTQSTNTPNTSTTTTGPMKKKTIESIPLPVGPNAESVDVTQVKFVCDIMLEALAKVLRRNGIDTISLTSQDDRDKCIKIANSQNRYILTRGSHFNRCVQHVPLGHCYRISTDTIDLQLMEVVNYYKIIIREENVFSRCQICNSNGFFMVSQNQMKQMTDNQYYDSDTPSTSSVRDSFPNRTWQLDEIPPACLQSKTTFTGAPIQCMVLPRAILNSIHLFQVCQTCGKCYWEGTHYNRLLTGSAKSILTPQQCSSIALT